MAETSKLVIEVDSKGVLTASGNLEIFAKMGQKAGKSSDDLANKMGALQLIANKLPGPLKSIAAGLMGMVNPTTAVIGVVMELGEAAVRYIGEAVNAYAEFEAQSVRLGAVLKATGAETWTTTSALTKYANELQTATGKSANEIKRMQSVLLGFQSITGENFDRLTKNMLDMVDVMGGDMVSAANTFGKAMDNPVESLGALSRYGFKFTEEEKRMVKAMQEANDIAGAQVVILKSMEKAFGGASEAHAKTIQGMKEYIKTLKEQHKALVAEYSGMADVVKDYHEMQIRYYEGLNKALSENIELEKITAKESASGGVTLEEYYRKLQLQVNKTKREIEKMEAEDQTHTNMDKRLEEYEKLLKLYNPVMEAEKKRTTELEKQLKIINDQKNTYNSVMNSVRDALASTPEAKIKEIQGLINQAKKFLEIGKGTEQYHTWDTASRAYRDTEKLRPLKKNEIDDTNEAIRIWQKQIDEIRKSGRASFEDWVKILASATGYTEEMVNNLKGLGTVEKYAADIERIQNTLLSQDGDLIKALGLDKIDVLESSADKARSVLEAMLNSGKWNGTEKSVQFLIEKLRQLDEIASGSHFEKFLDEIKKETELLGKSPQEVAIHNAKELLKNNRVKDPTDEQAEQVLGKTFDRDKKKLELQEQSIWLSEEELRINELIAQYGDEAKAKQIYAFEQQIEKTKVLKDALQSLAQAGLNVTASGLVDFAHDLGSAFRDGTISSDELSGAVGNMLRAMIDAMPQLLLNVGLQLIMAKQWPLGLAFIGASGLMSFVSGMIDDSSNNGKDDEAERLRRIQDQITDLIEQQRKQEEYYATKKRSVNASSISVNDAIITPKGTVYTSPEDYIIATKKPESLMSNGGGGNVFINIQNNAPVKVETETETADDGSKIVKVIIEKTVESGIANGRFDGAFNAMNNRRGGRRLQN